MVSELGSAGACNPFQQPLGPVARARINLEYASRELNALGVGDLLPMSRRGSLEVRLLLPHVV